MQTRRTLLIAAACTTIAASGPAPAEDAAARAFVASIYETYVGRDGNGVQLDSEKTIRRYFEPALAALILKDQKNAERRNEAPTLDGDPFVDGQDWDIAAYTIVMADTGPGKATATVSFNSAGTPTTVVLDLVKIKNDWRIGDITWQHDGKPETLRGLFAR
jgi:Protein of unknown function (DUF3828)